MSVIVVPFSSCVFTGPLLVHTDQECLRASILSKSATPIETHSLVKIIGTY